MKFLDKIVNEYWHGTKAPGLYVGRKIGDHRLKGEVISLGNYSMVIKVIAIDDKYYDKYLDIGGLYPLFRHEFFHKDLMTWQVQPPSMKKQIAPLLLRWEKGVGWNWDLK